MEYFLDPIKNHYADFNGRASRKQFWMYALYYVLIAAAITVVERIIGFNRGAGPGFLYGLFVIAVLIPSFAITVRRLHDSGKTGWLALLWFIPVIGTIAIIILCALEGETGENQYGYEPGETEMI